MESTQFKNAIECTFGDLIAQFEEGEEFAFYEYGPKVISRVGYSTNISPQIVKQAAKNKVDLIITHHDAWDFVFGMKEKCHSLLKEFGINHFFVHLPLDYAEFGTCNSLFKALGVIITGAGNSTINIRDAFNAGCDVYITGEKTLYTVQYAQFVGMNLIVGSHTFTEIFGVRALAEKIKELFSYLEIVELEEEHFE